MKPLKFVGSALEDLQGFAVAARRRRALNSQKTRAADIALAARRFKQIEGEG